MYSCTVVHNTKYTYFEVISNVSVLTALRLPFSVELTNCRCQYPSQVSVLRLPQSTLLPVYASYHQFTLKPIDGPLRNTPFILPNSVTLSRCKKVRQGDKMYIQLELMYLYIQGGLAKLSNGI